MSNQSENFNMAIDHFSSEQEETCTVATFAAGNEFNCYLLDATSLITFQATSLLETSTSSSLPHSQLEGVADLLWGPLFENSQNAEEST